MKASTLQNRIDSNLRTKSGEIAVKYQNVEKVLMGNRYHGAGYSGRGRYTSKANGDHFSVIEGLRKIGVDFVEGNDKTQMGWSYDYFVYVKGKDIGRFEMLADAKTFCDVDAKKAHQTASIIIEKMN